MPVGTTLAADVGRRCRGCGDWLEVWRSRFLGCRLGMTWVTVGGMKWGKAGPGKGMGNGAEVWGVFEGGGSGFPLSWE